MGTGLKGGAQQVRKGCTSLDAIKNAPFWAASCYYFTCPPGREHINYYDSPIFVKELFLSYIKIKDF